MHSLYNLCIYFYGVGIMIASLFSKKARLRYLGARKTNAIIREFVMNQLNNDDKIVWMHAASLGEFEQGRPILDEIRKNLPNHKIVLSFFSPSGYEVRKHYEEADLVCYLPIDSVKNVRKFLDILRPDIAIFVKYEFWANFLFELKRRCVKTYIISAIFRKDQIFFHSNGAFFVEILKCFTHLFVQNEESVDLLKSVAIENVTIAGDTRFDRVKAIADNAKKIDLIDKFANNKQLIIAGSTWPLDEDLLCQYINTYHAKCKMVIAPHEVHGKRINEICKKLECSYIKWSELHAMNLSYNDYDCLIIDTIGILSSVYQYGKIAYVGGGFGVGIHNTLEAATWGMPILWGPKYHKFQEAKDLILCGAAYSISNYNDLEKRLDKLMRCSQAQALAAQKYVNEKVGATGMILSKILSE